MDELLAFIMARLDEYEAAAKAATPGVWLALDGGVQSAQDETQWPVSASESDRDRADRVHIARHHPARVLREVEAKRALIAFALKNAESIDGEWGDGCTAAQIAAGQCGSRGTEAALAILLPIAAIDRDHPDYLAEWTPS